MKINWRVIILFILAMGVSQILIKLLSPSNFFTSPMYILLPLVGFFSAYYIAPAVMKYMKINDKHVFAGIFVVLGVICFYIVLFIFYWNVLKVLNQQPISFPYWQLLLDSAFFEFIVAGAFGIISIK